jgi:threonine dehydratase
VSTDNGSFTVNSVRPITIIEVPRLAKRLGIDLVLVSETFQHTGSFKFRAAFHLASHVPHRLLLTASSGNFGQALAYACSLLGKTCIVVMPESSAKVKIDAVREYDGGVELVDTRVKSRAERLRELALDFPEAYVSSPYDDPLVIEGNSSLGREISQMRNQPNVIVAPVGGGGLIAGIIKGLADSNASIEVLGAEPLLGNDAARSLRAGALLSNSAEPATIADGARTLSLGKHNWAIIRDAVSKIVEIPEKMIVESVRLLFLLGNLKVEPTGALAVAAVMTRPELFRGRSVCCLISGGNVDPTVYAELIAGSLVTLGS